MADLPERRSEGSLRLRSLLPDSSPPKAGRRHSSKRDRNGANRDGNPDENPPSFFVIPSLPEPLEPAPRMPNPTPPQEPGFINGADYIPVAGSEDEYDPDASNRPNVKKRKLGARETEERSAIKQTEGSGDRGRKDHLYTPWMQRLNVDPSDNISSM